MLEKLLKPYSIILRHHAESGGLPAEKHNAYHLSLELDRTDLRDLIDRNPAFVEGYSEKDIGRSIRYTMSCIPDTINLVIKSNNELPVTDQGDHTDLEALREELVRR